MDFFENMYQTLSGFDVTVVLAKNHALDDGQLTVSILPKSCDGATVACAPFVMVATPAYLDSHFEELFQAPAQATTDLFEVSARYAAQARQKADAVGKPAAATASPKAVSNPAAAPAVRPATPTVSASATLTNPANLSLKKANPAFDKCMKDAEVQTAARNWKFARMYLKEALKLIPDHPLALSKLGAVERQLEAPSSGLFAAPTLPAATVSLPPEPEAEPDDELDEPEPNPWMDPEEEEPEEEEPESDEEPDEEPESDDEEPEDDGFTL